MSLSREELPNVDVIVRFHDAKRVFELERCLLSLACTEEVFVRAKLVCQRFSPSEIADVKNRAKPFEHIGGAVEIEILNYTNERPVDARSALLNLGIRNSESRYLAFLDYDDVIYPHGYKLLIDKLSKEGASITFGGIYMKHVIQKRDFAIATSKEKHRKGALLDLFIDNFCPLHSYLIDREKVDSADLYFDEKMPRLEDYHFLIRFCAKYQSSFSALAEMIGDYYWKDDGSNSTLVPSSDSEDNRLAWQTARKVIKLEKEAIVLAPGVLNSLGIKTKSPPISVADVVKIQAQRCRRIEDR
jgi:hypothetical protein